MICAAVTTVMLILVRDRVFLVVLTASYYIQIATFIALKDIMINNVNKYYKT